MAVKNFPAVRKSAYIFVQTDLKVQREQRYRWILGEIDRKYIAKESSWAQKQNMLHNLYPPAYYYTNAMQRAAAAESFFTRIFKIDKVEILKNLSKEEIIAKLNEI